jgi:transcriptional regulator with XRE-family HTH domain
MDIKKIERLKNKAYRDAYVGSHIDQGLAYQIKALRDQRNWTQEKLAKELGLKSQSAVVRYEDPSYGKLSLSKIKQLGSIFDVAVLIKFVPYSRFLSEIENTSAKAFHAINFESELPVLEEDCESPVNYRIWDWNNFNERMKIPEQLGSYNQKKYLTTDQADDIYILTNLEETEYANDD